MGEKRKTINCLNCTHVLKKDDRFCPSCGQENNDLNVPVKFLFNDFIHDFLNFDSKFFKTFIPLLIKPGFLTNEFKSGKRIAYVPPFRLYIICSFLFFGILSINSIFTDNKTETENNINISIDEKNSFLDEFKNSSSKEALLDTFEIGKTDLNLFFASQFLKLINDSGSSFKATIFKNISFMMFVLMPVFALIIMLVNYKKKLFFINHLIFSYHLHSFIFLFMGVIVGLNYIFDLELLNFILTLAIFYYLFKMFRNVYFDSIFATNLKLFVSGIFYFVAFTFVFLINLFISFLMI